MDSPLFHVHCTTCGIALPFSDESQLGEIIECPKCHSMVLVEKEKQQQPEKTVQVPPSASSFSIPSPPPPPVQFSQKETDSEIPESEETENTTEEVFRFEGETASGPSTRFLMIVAGGIAAGIFLTGVILFFIFVPKQEKKSALDLKLPEPVSVEQFRTESEEESETELEEKIEEGVEEETAVEETEGEAETTEISETAETETSAEDALKAETSDVESNKKEENENSDSEHGVSQLMQSNIGKMLSEELSKEEPEFSEKQTSDLDANINADEEETENTDEKSPSPSTESEVQESTGGENTKESVTDEKSQEEVGKDADALQFTRHKRSRTYAGEDPVLNFDSATQAPEEDSSSKKRKDSSENSDTNSETEDSINVSSPNDEVVSEQPQAPKLKTFRIPAPTIEYLNSDFAEKLNLPLESISMKKRPVTSLIQLATQMSGIRIAADWKKLETLGISMDSPITLQLENTTLREALDTGLYTVGLGVLSFGSSPRVVGWEAVSVARSATEKGEKQEKHILELEDLAETLAAETSGKSALGELARLIPQFVHPALWEDSNGPGRMNLNTTKGKITLTQYPSVIREVELFFDKIRHARNMELKNLTTNPNQRREKLNDGTEIYNYEIVSRYAASEKIRSTPISCDLSDGSTLRSTLLEIMRCADSQLIIDEAAVSQIPITAVWEDAEVPDFEGNKRKLPDSILDLPCAYHFEGIPLQEAVSDVLKNVPLLCYPIEKNLFFLTTHEEAHRKMLVDFFPVGDIVKNEKAAGTVRNGICEKLQPESWSQNGGAGEIYFDVPSKSFIVRQNPYVLYQLEMFLQRFRQTQNPEERMEARE